MKNLEKNVELLSQYLESVFETYSVKNVGKKQSLEVRGIYQQGDFGRYFKLKKPLPPASSEVDSICRELVEEIFTPNKYIKADVSLYFEGSKIFPKKNNATLYITELWEESILYLDDIYLSLTRRDYSLFRNLIKPSEVPKKRSVLFSWILFKLAELISELGSSLKYYVFVKYSREKSYLHPDPSTLRNLLRFLSEIYTKSSKEVMVEIFTDLLIEHDPKSALLKWIRRDKSMRKNLIQAFKEDPISLMKMITYSHLSSRFSDLKEMKSKIGLDEKLIFKGAKIWAEKNFDEIMTRVDVLSDPSSVLQWRDFLGEELTKRIGKISREFQTPLHEREIPHVEPESRGKYGEFRLVQISSDGYLSEEDYKPVYLTINHVLQKLIDQTWTEVLIIETYSYEKELYDSKEYESSGPEFYPRIFIDEKKRKLYIEKTDGTLFYSKDYGKTWKSAEGEIKSFLYEKRLNFLKYFEVESVKQ